MAFAGIEFFKCERISEKTKAFRTDNLEWVCVWKGPRMKRDEWNNMPGILLIKGKKEERSFFLSEISRSLKFINVYYDDPKTVELRFYDPTL